MELIKLYCEARKAFDENTNYKDAKDFGLEFSFKQKDEITNGRIFEITIKNSSSENFLGVIHVKAMIPKLNPKSDIESIESKNQIPKVFMPGFIYGWNTGEKPNYGRKDFPRIRLGNPNKPESSYWFTRSDRLAEPMSLLYINHQSENCDTSGDYNTSGVTGTGGDRIFGVAAKPYFTNDDNSFYQYAGFSCNVDDGDFVSVGYTLGYEDAPWLFIQSMTVLDRKPLTEENCFEIAAGKEIKFDLRVYDYTAENETGIYEAIQDVYFTYHEPPRKIEGMTIRKATELLTNSIRDYAWLEDEKMYTGFVYDAPNGNRTNKIGSLTWTNGMSVATPMLMAANKLHDDEMRRQALTFIEEVVAHSLNEKSGLLYDAVDNGKWSVHGWWYDGMKNGGHSGYLNGQALYYIMKAYLSEKSERNIEHSEWIEFVRPVIEKLNQIKNTDGEYPFSMSERTGAGLEYDSLGGAWCLAATALFSKITGEKKYLDEMKKSEQHYYDTFIKKCECYGGPLDTDKAVDDEGILAYVRAARILHEITGDEKYLLHLRDGIYYETTFKLGYNTPVKVKPLSDIGWSSSGGSITSTANPHIHPMSSTIVDEMIYLLKHTGDKYVEERLADTLGWGLQTFNTRDKEYGYGKIGWMSERFCFCQGLVVEKYPDGTLAGTWFALMSWAVASVVEGFVGDGWE